MKLAVISRGDTEYTATVYLDREPVTYTRGTVAKIVGLLSQIGLAVATTAIADPGSLSPGRERDLVGEQPSHRDAVELGKR